MKFSSELLKGSTKNLILSVLSGKKMYGYEIIKAIKDESDDLITLGEGSVYPALHELESRGLLTSNWVAQNNLPDRKYYTLTKKGGREFKAAAAEWKLFAGAVNKIYRLGANH